MRALIAMILSTSLLVSSVAMAADNAGPLAPGKPAGVKQAELGTTDMGPDRLRRGCRHRDRRRVQLQWQPRQTAERPGGYHHHGLIALLARERLPRSLADCGRRESCTMNAITGVRRAVYACVLRPCHGRAWPGRQEEGGTRSAAGREPNVTSYQMKPVTADVENTDEQRLNADADQDNWRLHGRTYDNQRFSPLTQINAVQCRSS